MTTVAPFGALDAAEAFQASKHPAQSSRLAACQLGRRTSYTASRVHEIREQRPSSPVFKTLHSHVPALRPSVRRAMLTIMARSLDACKADLAALEEYLLRTFGRPLDHEATLALLERIIADRIAAAIHSRFRDWPTSDLDSLRSLLGQRKRRPSKADIAALES